MTIGANARVPTTTGFNGSIDEVAIFNRTLTSQEILDFYNRGATKLNLTVRSCDDSSCNGETFTDVNDNSSLNLSLNQNRYFQYSVQMDSLNISVSPQLYNLSISYTPVYSPNVTYNFPTNLSYTSVNYSLLNYSINDQDSSFVNVSVYGDGVQLN